jgi:two-component system response regulator HydG
MTDRATGGPSVNLTKPAENNGERRKHDSQNERQCYQFEMRADQLDLRELLDFEPDGGIITFAGQRALIFDAVALGLLRLELINVLGVTGARAVLTHFGFAHGWRTAETLKDALPWDSEREWRIAGGRLHRLQGLVVFEPVSSKKRKGDDSEPFAEGIWKQSYEAEQHLLHVGQSDEPVCWTLAGFASGYLSRSNDREIYVMEERCRGKGDAACRAIGRTKEEWGDRIAGDLPFYEQSCLGELNKTLARSLKSTERRLRTRKAELSRVSGTSDDATGIVARSEAMRKVLELATRVAKVDSTVLVTGESGVGKERVSRHIHDESSRAAHPFVAINCGAVPEGLLESELFGHARGAFTGATQDRAGMFESANGGTLLLDEVGDIPQAMQVKLLRALQEREIRRVGENKSRPIDVRIVAATNRDLPADVISGRFRQDLYYRLRVIELYIPPLRERTDDILPLARIHLAEAAARLGANVTGFTPKAAQRLVRYAWPGNVRELANAIERAVVVASGRRIDEADLPDETRDAVGASGASGTNGRVRRLDEVEREAIFAALKAVGGSKAKAAVALGIGQATLFRKLKTYGVRA